MSAALKVNFYLSGKVEPFSSCLADSCSLLAPFSLQMASPSARLLFTRRTKQSLNRCNFFSSSTCTGTGSNRPTTYPPSNCSAPKVLFNAEFLHELKEVLLKTLKCISLDQCKPFTAYNSARYSQNRKWLPSIPYFKGEGLLGSRSVIFVEWMVFQPVRERMDFSCRQNQSANCSGHVKSSAQK